VVQIPAKPGPEDGMVVRLRAKVVVRVAVYRAFLLVEEVMVVRVAELLLPVGNPMVME
jgi:hypothetical protein